MPIADQVALRDQGDLVAILGVADVLRRDEDRPPSVAEPVELLPDLGSEDRVDAGGRLVEEQQDRLMDERAGQLEAALHAARHVARPAVAGVPQLEQLEAPRGPACAAPPEQPEQAADEVDVLAGGQVRGRA